MGRRYGSLIGGLPLFFFVGLAPAGLSRTARGPLSTPKREALATVVKIKGLIATENASLGLGKYMFVEEGIRKDLL